MKESRLDLMGILNPKASKCTRLAALVVSEPAPVFGIPESLALHICQGDSQSFFRDIPPVIHYNRLLNQIEQDMINLHVHCHA